MKRVIDGKSELADRSQILLPDRQSAELAAAGHNRLPWLAQWASMLRREMRA